MGVCFLSTLNFSSIKPDTENNANFENYASYCLQSTWRRLKTLQHETPSNIYKWFILPETRVIDLHFRRW